MKFFDKLENANISECFINANANQLNYLISLTKNYNLNIHGWIWTLNRPYDERSSKNLNWYSVNKKGQNSYEYRPYVDYYQWLSLEPKDFFYSSNFVINFLFCFISNMTSV